MMGPRGACRPLIALKQHGALLSLILVGFDVLVVGCCDCERDDTTPGGTPVVLNPPIGSGITDSWVWPWLSCHPFSRYSPTGSTRFDVWVGIFTQYQATCYVSKHTMVYDEGE